MGRRFTAWTCLSLLDGRDSHGQRFWWTVLDRCDNTMIDRVMAPERAEAIADACEAAGGPGAFTWVPAPLDGDSPEVARMRAVAADMISDEPDLVPVG